MLSGSIEKSFRVNINQVATSIIGKAKSAKRFKGEVQKYLNLLQPDNEYDEEETSVGM